VGNFGVPGYGTDQALLRFEANEADRAPVSILGIYPEDVMRNVSQYFYLLGTRNGLSFKPRFSLADGELRLVPKPEPTFEQLKLLSSDLRRLLPYETFLPETDLGPQPMRFPYTLVVLKLLFRHHRVRNWLLGVPSWQDFIQKDHPSHAQEVTIRIAKRFMDGCKERGKKCFVVLFPTPSSYKHFIATERVVAQPLMGEFDKMAIPYLDLTPGFAEYVGVRGFCKMKIQTEQCTGHFNAEGNRLVAEVVRAYLVQHALHTVQ